MKRSAFIIFIVWVILISFNASVFADDFYVIPVQNKCGRCEGTLSAGGRWCDNGDGTVTDNTTCLVWLKYTNWGGNKKWRNDITSGATVYDDAHTRASELKSGTIVYSSSLTDPPTIIFLNDGSVEGDWRLPTSTELLGVKEGDEGVDSGNEGFFWSIDLEYWTSTTKPDNVGAAMVILFWGGGPGSALSWDEKYDKNRVWPVRIAK